MQTNRTNVAFYVTSRHYVK